LTGVLIADLWGRTSLITLAFYIITIINIVSNSVTVHRNTEQQEQNTNMHI